MVERVRGGRTFVILTLYIGLLSVVLYATYEVGRQNDDPTESALLGRTMFEWLLFFMLLLVLFMVPGLAAGAVAGERERQTLVPLQVTLLSPRQILTGKIGAAVAFLLLLVVATLPLLSVSYLIGGVTFGEVLGGLAAVVYLGLVLGCLTATISAFARRVQGATVLAYGLVLLLVLGTLAVWGGAMMVDESRGIDEGNPPSWLLLANPLATVSGVVSDGSAEGSNTESPFDWVEGLVEPQEEFDRFGNFVGDEGGGVPSDFLWGSVALLFGLSAAAVVLGARRLRTPAVTER
jgi:ABC-type transport system involved in multi-copper enzyme maturation permease subunit